MAVQKEKQEALLLRMRGLEIEEEDIVEKFVLGSGRGGQKVNKTSSCVYLKHIPTGIEVKCQKSRFREINRFVARTILCDRLEARMENVKTEKQREREKIKRQKRRRSRRSKEKMLREKRVHGQKKALRGSLKETLEGKPLL